MPKLHNSIHIAATADEVWAVVGDLARTTEWIPGIVSVDVEGELRVCRTADGNEINERVFDYSAEDRMWRYEQNRVPLPIEASRGRLRVIPDGRGARVDWEAEFDSSGEVAAMVDGYYKQTLEALRRRMETGQSPATM